MSLRRLVRRTALMSIAVLVPLSACGSLVSDGSSDDTDRSTKDLKGTVYFLTPNSQITRFASYDAPAMRAYFKKHAPGLKLVVQSADNDPARQLQQAQAAVTKGAKLIIMAPPVPDQSQSVVEVAHNADLKVIDYAYASTNSSIDYYVTVPFEPIGTAAAKHLVEQTKGDKKPVRVAHITGDPSFFFDTEIAKGIEKVLAPLEKSGQVEVVCENDNLQLSTDNARKATEACLEKAGGSLDAVIAHNDSSVNGVVAALSAQKLLGRTKIFGGYDAEAGTVQQVLAGNVANTARPPFATMGRSAAKLAVAIISGDDAAAKALVNGQYDTGTKKVPTVYLDNVFVTKDTVQKTILDAGILRRKDVCGGPAADSAFCTK